MNAQSNVEVSQKYNASNAPAAVSRNASTPATNAMIVRLETTKTGLWTSRPRIWTLSRPSPKPVCPTVTVRVRRDGT